MKQNVTVTTNKETLTKMKEFYNDFLVENNGEYVFFQANVNDVVVTGYISNKERQKVTFSGENALLEASIWDKDAKENEVKHVVKEDWIYLGDQIGSDEVGVGDFLAPMVVCAALVRYEDLPLLKKWGVHDSKKLNDEQILEIGEALKDKFKFSKLTLPNEKYNEMISKGENLNSLKAKMHNRALLNLHEAYPEVRNIFVDQFVEPKTYYNYLNDANEKQVRGIYFQTKGESYFPSVALASVLARYSFLKDMEKLSEKYGMEIPLGASSKVDAFAVKFMEKYGIDELKKIAKCNFANFKKLTETKLF